ncbi:MAG TPA: AAA family ATPase, partial [Methylomirabilota bacterium]|nr:AAA family ATPase [Methylomirabilota bacterium]
MIVSIATQKGGAGKTTTSIALSAGLARKGKKVLLVDIDQQANSSKVLLHHYPTITKEQSVHATIIERKPLPIHKTDVPNLDIVPGHILLSNTDVELTIAKDRREDRLKRELDKVKDNYDFVFIDCPPNLGWLTINALTASDQVIIVAPGYFELDSIVQFYKTKEEVQEFFNPTLQLMGILFTRSDPTVNTRESLSILRQMYGKELLPVIIPENTDL